MLLLPKNTKYSKSFSSKKVKKLNNNKKTIMRFSNNSLISYEAGIITNFQLESLRRYLRRLLKKKAQIFFRLVVTRPITKKPNEVRLGKGKGSAKYWAYFEKKNEVLVELNSTNNKITKNLKNASLKLSLKSFFFQRNKRWIF